MEQASKQAHSQAVAEMYRSTNIFDNVQGAGGSGGGAQQMEGVDTGVQGDVMPRDAILDREARALETGDPMELEQLALAHQEFLDSTSKRARVSGKARSPKDIFNVNLQKACLDTFRNDRSAVARGPVVCLVLTKLSR